MRVLASTLAAGDLPLPTSIPPFIGLAIVALWVAAVWGVVVVLRWRRALRAERRATLSRPRAVTATDRELDPPRSS